MWQFSNMFFCLNMPISCGPQAHWLSLSDRVHARCPSWHSGGTLHIFVSCYQSKTSGWVPAVAHRVVCPDTTCLSAAAMTALYRPSWGWRCSFSFLSSLHWHRPDLPSIGLTFPRNQMRLCGWSLLALLPSHFWLIPLLITPMTTCHKFPLLETPRN